MFGSTIRNCLFPGLALIVAGPAFADVKAGVDAWTRGDYATAIAEWKGPAEQGDADAQFNLGQAYKLGRGVKQDLAKAEDLFGKAAAQGHLQASDNYGLLLFQRGERAKALPYIHSAADRGDPRAQYLLGIAHFNGDGVPKDWVRAYALLSLAQQGGLSQAAGALAQMDQYVPLEQRQQSIALAQELSAQAEATRARQLAAADLGSKTNVSPTAPVVTAMARPPAIATAEQPPVVESHGPSAPGADFTRPRPPVASAPARAVTPAHHSPTPAPSAHNAATATDAQPRTPAVAATRTQQAAPQAGTSSGSWRVQLGAFGVSANADSLWAKIRTRPELAGHPKVLVPAGSVTKLQAGNFPGEDAARSACSRLAAGGIACLAVRN